ncbi:uncharacterized protein LOC132561828 [Ylistrum balloti]|uniref:uncharacterized protein LOC132561828 n=1 Tax=Ylistrum balloti TaxID=509963 RepID=UPI002905B157|nr:uncharacterized protein LOC132561828 [Ylistrum balloti]
MNAEVRDYISKCSTCRAYEDKQQKETLISNEVPDRPWFKVGCDLFTIHRIDYLITTNYYSNFFKVDHLTDTKSWTVINVLRAQFARYGISATVISDNGMEIRTPYPQSNLKVEQSVKTTKGLMRLGKELKSYTYLALIGLRNTQSMDSSSAQHLMGRRTQILLPTKATILKSKTQKSVSRQLDAMKDKHITLIVARET